MIAITQDRFAAVAILISVALLNASCRRESNADRSKNMPTPQVAAGIIKGQVFVVTRGAENVRLGQLKIGLTTRKTFDELGLSEHATIERKRLYDEFETAKKRGNETERVISEIKSNFSDLVYQRDLLVDRLRASEVLHTIYEAVLSDIHHRDLTLDRLENELRNAGIDSYGGCQQIANLIRRLPRQLATEAYQRLLPRSSFCKTDADGRFRFECPAEIAYVVFTRGHRQIPSGDSEEYGWFISARPSQDEKRQVLLTNDNLVDGPAADNLMRSIFEMPADSELTIPLSQSRELLDRKPLPRKPRWAPAGSFFLINYVSVTTKDGVVGFSPGTLVTETTHIRETYSVKAGEVSFDVPLAWLTDNVEFSERLRQFDSDIQSQVASWQTLQRQINQQTSDEQNARYDEAQKRIEDRFKKLHSLTGESRLNEPAHR